MIWLHNFLKPIILSHNFQLLHPLTLLTM